MSAGTAELRALVAEVVDDLAAAQGLIDRLGEVGSRIAQATEPDPCDVMAAAAFLHHLNTAMEAVHERIVRAVDGTTPSAERWHQDLLQRVGLELPGVRPAVLRPSTRAALARLLRFRHFFRPPTGSTSCGTR